MKLELQSLLLPLLLTLLASPAQAKLNVVASLPDFAAIAEEIGGEATTLSFACAGEARSVSSRGRRRLCNSSFIKKF